MSFAQDVADLREAGGLRVVAENEPPFALSLAEFIATKSDVPPALVGEGSEILLAHAGLLILYAKGGKGKTTLSLDAAFHFASGVPWLGFDVARPLRLLIIENEGPREPFREKLALKRQAWPRDIPGEIFVYTESWGGLRLSDGVDRLRQFIEAQSIDLVIGDPLDSLGVKGVGSPEDTREFVELLKACGLFQDVAFWLLHHGRKQEADDELDEISGAWGGRPDSMLKLDKLDGNRARLSFPKIRWSRRGTRSALILAFEPEAEGFAAVGEDSIDDDRDYLTEITTLLAAKPSGWLTPKQIAAPKDKGGIGANVDKIRHVLDSNRTHFEERTGDGAKAMGRQPTAHLWQVTRPPESPESASDSLGHDEEVTRVTPPLRESPGHESAHHPRQKTQPVESPDPDDELDRIAHPT